MKFYLKIFWCVFFALSFSLKSQQKNDSVFASIQKYLYEDPDLAILETKKLLDTEQNPDKKIKYLLFLANTHTAKRNSDESYRTLLKVQELVKNSKDLNLRIVSLLQIASQYHQMELYNKSFEALDEVDLLCRNEGDSDIKKFDWQGKSFALKGMIYKSQGNEDIALQKFLSAIINLEKSKQFVGNINNLSIIYYNIGYIYIGRKEFSTAEIYFNKAISYAEKSKAKSLQAYAMKGLAENYTFQNQNLKALEILKTSSEKAGEIGDLVLNEGISKLLAENYLSTGNFEEYLKNNEDYKRIKFQREQGELKSINSLIDNMEQNKTTQIKEITSKNWMINFGLLLSSILISVLLLIKGLSKLKKNKIVQKKIAKMMVAHEK